MARKRGDTRDLAGPRNPWPGLGTVMWLGDLQFKSLRTAMLYWKCATPPRVPNAFRQALAPANGAAASSRFSDEIHTLLSCSRPMMKSTILRPCVN